jgi:hypothetical protein
MKSARRLAVLMLVFVASAFAAEEAVRGKVVSVTLYRGQALVTRLVPVDLPAGNGELVVGPLPERVVADSLFAAAAEGVHIRGVRYRTRVLSVAAREDVRKLDGAIEDVEKALRQLQSELQTLQQQGAYLQKLETFVAPTAQTELTRGVLNAETLQTLTRFMFTERARIAEAALALQEKERQHKRDLAELQARRAQLTKDSSLTEREAVLFLERLRPGPTEIRLSYLVQGASWAPAYNVRTSGEMKDVSVEYNAVIQQMSGEDWQGVDLSLSTASPALVADAPRLAPLLVTLSPLPPQAPPAQTTVQDLANAQVEVQQAEQRRKQTKDFGGQVDAQWSMNVYSGRVQVMEYNLDELVPAGGRDLRIARPSMLSVNYRLEGPVSVDSRADQQIVRIARLELPARFVNLAVPLFTEHVYREARITNSSDVALLEGQCSVYLDGDFVGSAAVPLVARGQEFVLGFGVDPQLRARREFVSRDEQVQGGNRILAFGYRLVLENYKKAPVSVRLLDRIPTSQEDIKVTLGELKEPLSDESEYVRTARPNGILRWDVEVPAGATRAEPRIVEYSFRLEFDRNMKIQSVLSGQKAEAAREMFEEDVRMKH